MVELKKAQELPKTFWETYSSFSNTSGGLIVLGVEEAEPVNTIVGVGNVKKTITTLWDTLSNPNKVSYKNIENEDVVEFEIEPGKVIILLARSISTGVPPAFVGSTSTWSVYASSSYLTITFFLGFAFPLAGTVTL